jgi:acetyl-CoA C-acetyltransferase
MEEVVIVSACRTPFGAFGGTLKDFTHPELAGIVITEALRRADVRPDEVDEVALGVNLPGSDRSIARQAMLKAGIPEEKVAYTVDRACCSALTAIDMASKSIRLGEARIAVAGGAENMSRVPYFFHEARWGKRLGDITLKDQLVISCPYTGVPRAVQAGQEALEFGIGREEQDRWALRSQQMYAKAKAEGKFQDEIVPVQVPQPKGEPILFAEDEQPRPDTTLEKLAKLPTVYGSPTVTAGNAPGLNTGATAVVLMSRRVAEERGTKPLATIISYAMVSGHPQRIASIPAVAAKLALQKIGMTIDDMDLIEVNEAFAAVPLVTTKVLAEGNEERLERIRSRTNVNGGAIAVGHPTGATGARLVMTLVYELRRRGGGFGLVTICGGIGEAESVIVKV